MYLRAGDSSQPGETCATVLLSPERLVLLVAGREHVLNYPASSCLMKENVTNENDHDCLPKTQIILYAIKIV